MDGKIIYYRIIANYKEKDLLYSKCYCFSQKLKFKIKLEI